MVAANEVVAIVDRDLLDQSRDFRHFYNRLRAQGRIYGQLGEAKTLIVTTDSIVLSSISSQTLVRRLRRRPGAFE